MVTAPYTADKWKELIGQLEYLLESTFKSGTHSSTKSPPSVKSLLATISSKNKQHFESCSGKTIKVLLQSKNLHCSKDFRLNRKLYMKWAIRKKSQKKSACTQPRKNSCKQFVRTKLKECSARLSYIIFCETTIEGKKSDKLKIRFQISDRKSHSHSLETSHNTSSGLFSEAEIEFRQLCRQGDNFKNTKLK